MGPFSPIVGELSDTPYDLFYWIRWDIFGSHEGRGYYLEPVTVYYKGLSGTPCSPFTKEFLQVITSIQAHVLSISRTYSVDSNSRRIRVIIAVIRRNKDIKSLVSIGSAIIIGLLSAVKKRLIFLLLCIYLGLQKWENLDFFPAMCREMLLQSGTSL